MALTKAGMEGILMSIAFGIFFGWGGGQPRAREEAGGGGCGRRRRHPRGAASHGRPRGRAPGSRWAPGRAVPGFAPPVRPVARPPCNHPLIPATNAPPRYNFWLMVLRSWIARLRRKHICRVKDYFACGKVGGGRRGSWRAGGWWLVAGRCTVAAFLLSPQPPFLLRAGLHTLGPNRAPPCPAIPPRPPRANPQLGRSIFSETCASDPKDAILAVQQARNAMTASTYLATVSSLLATAGEGGWGQGSGAGGSEKKRADCRAPVPSVPAGNTAPAVPLPVLPPPATGITILLDPQKTNQIQKLAVGAPPTGGGGSKRGHAAGAGHARPAPAPAPPPAPHACHRTPTPPPWRPQLQDPCLRSLPGDPLTTPQVVLMLALVSLYSSFMFFAQVGAGGRRPAGAHRRPGTAASWNHTDSRRARPRGPRPGPRAPHNPLLAAPLALAFPPLSPQKSVRLYVHWGYYVRCATSPFNNDAIHADDARLVVIR
jgi:hypothetical protein